MVTENPLNCPRCKQVDATQKVSSIVAEGVTTGQYQSMAPLKWGDETHYLPVQREVISASMLAKKLMLPSMPEVDDKKLLLWCLVHYKWAQLYYCKRCDGIFIPGQERFIPVEQVHSFLQEDKEEFCLIQDTRVGSPLNLKVKYRFSANAIKSNRVYSIRQVDWEEGFVSKHVHPSSNCAKCRQAFEELVQSIESDGWHVIEKHEQWWYSWLFTKA
jgi:hypothetical protein